MPGPHALTLSALFRHFQKNDAVGHSRVLLRLLRARTSGARNAMLTHALGDDWLDFAQESLTQYFEGTRGFVYIAQSPQYPEIFKVGKTAGAPEIRIAQLSNEAVLLSFKPVSVVPVHDRHFIEKTCHQALTNAGVPRLKEFFKTSPEHINLCIQQCISDDLHLISTQGFHVPNS